MSSANMAKVESDVQIAPLRSLDEFLLESARFQIPNLKDPDKWANRVINNLMYYQTNYFLTALIVFLIVGYVLVVYCVIKRICVGWYLSICHPWFSFCCRLIHPVKMFYGFLALAVAFGLFYYVTYERQPAQKFKRNHPLISVLVVLSGNTKILDIYKLILCFGWLHLLFKTH